MTYDELIPELKTVRYCCHRLIELNQELEVLNHQTTGLAKSGGIELTAEQKRSKWPMPTYQHQYHSPLGLFEEISAKEQELHHFSEKTDGPKMDRTSQFARPEHSMGSVHS